MQQPEQECNATATDVGFVVDVSGSVGEHYSTEKAFVKRMAEKINVSASGSHVSVVLFSNRAQLKIKFSDHKDINGFKSAMGELPYPMGNTRMDLGLDVAFNEMFQTANGMRTTVPKIVVLMTDGRNSKPLEQLNPAQKFHDAGIKVLVIGIGNVNKEELQSMVKNDKDLYIAKDFDQLTSDEFMDSFTGQCAFSQGKPSYSEILYNHNIFDIWNHTNL